MPSRDARRATPQALGMHLLALFLNGLVAHSAGLCIGAWVSDMRRAMTLQTVFMLTMMMAGGYYAQGGVLDARRRACIAFLDARRGNTQQVTLVPVWLSWLQRLSFTRYTYSALASAEYRGASY